MCVLRIIRLTFRNSAAARYRSHEWIIPTFDGTILDGVSPGEIRCQFYALNNFVEILFVFWDFPLLPGKPKFLPLQDVCGYWLPTRTRRPRVGTCLG